MKKLVLDLDALRVVSFATVEGDDGAQGTVHANEDTLPSEMNCTKTGCPTQNCETEAPYC